MIVMKMFIIYAIRKLKFSTKYRFEDLKFEMQVTYAIINKDVIEVHLRDKN